MKKSLSQLADSDDDMDNLPLKYISSSLQRTISIKELRRFSIHACEFCEKKFKNRYDYLIHNAKHIIIPLIKLLPHQCPECNLYCLSEEEITHHMSVKHKKINNSYSVNTEGIKIRNSEKCDIDIQDTSRELNEDDKPLKYLVQKVKANIDQNHVTENILQNFVMNCKVDLEKFVPPWPYRSVETDNKSSNVIEKCRSNFNNRIGELESSTTPNNLCQSDRVIVETNILELNTSAEESSVIRNEKNFKDLSSEFSDLDDDPIVILAPAKCDNVSEEYSENISIHFDDLIKPGIFYCKRCFKRFPNRYEVVVHELVHLDLSEVIPDSYKLKHIKHSKSTIALTSKTISEHVTRCDRSYEDIADKDILERACFRFNCSACCKGYNNKANLAVHEGKCNGEAVVHMCDTCLYVRKRPKHIEYYGIVRFSNRGAQRVCHWCGELCADVSLVTLISKQRLADRIRFEGDAEERNIRVSELSALRKVDEQTEKQISGARKRGAGHGSKNLSNWDRLSSIQKRLKMMKK